MIPEPREEIKPIRNIAVFSMYVHVFLLVAGLSMGIVPTHLLLLGFLMTMILSTSFYFGARKTEDIYKEVTMGYHLSCMQFIVAPLFLILLLNSPIGGAYYFGNIVLTFMSLLVAVYDRNVYMSYGIR